jgi:hypothetical protein
MRPDLSERLQGRRVILGVFDRPIAEFVGQTA